MATRTISNTGGNYNATGTWVEGIVPTSADDVVATATSGQLTVNVASAARTIDLTNYTNTITMNANWTVSGVSLSSVIASSTTTFAGTVGVLVFSTAHTLSQLGSSRIPNLRLSGTSITKTLTSNLYCVNYDNNAQTSTINGFAIYCSGNIGIVAGFAGITGAISQLGTTKIVAEGSGNIFYMTGAPFEITGSYSTPHTQGLVLQNGASMSITGTISNAFILTIASTTALSNEAVTINSDKRINLINLSYIFKNSTYRQFLINLQQPLIADNIVCSTTARYGTSDNGIPFFDFSGSSLSASNVSLIPSLRTNSSTTTPVVSYIGPEIRLASGFTHSIGSLSAIGGLGSSIANNTNALIRSSTPGSQADINLISKTASQIINYNFTDINASGEQIVAINGTFSNTTNITNVYPSGSSGGGGAWTFVN